MTLSSDPPKGPPADTELYNSDRQMQIGTLVLTGINILAAVVMATRILLDTRKACLEQRNSLQTGDFAVFGEKGRKQTGDGVGRIWGSEVGTRGFGVEQGISASESSKRLVGSGETNTRAWWEMIPTTEVFPLILAVTLFLQGTMLAIVEGEGMNKKIFEGNCRFNSEVAWVALWITPYIVVSFTIEAAIRAVSQPRFQPRSGRAVLYCILFALVLTLLTWIPSRTMPESAAQDFCNGQLMSFVDQFSAGGLGLMLALLPISIFMGGVVVMHLTKGVEVGKVEKISTSRTIYFLIINIFQWILMVPNYALTAHNHPRSSTAGLATVVANLGGIAACGLHFYLREKTSSTYSEHEHEPHIVHLGAGRPLTQDFNISWQPYRSGGDDPVFPAFMNGFNNVLASPKELKRHTSSEHPDIETISILRVPYSPTSIYSKGQRSSRAPSLFSQYTTHSFKRLGEEINNMLTGLRAAESAATPNRPPPPPLPTPPTARKPASNYTLFPPSADRPRTPHAPIKSQVPLPPRTLSRPPRPSRATTPIVNMDRKQPNPKLISHMQRAKTSGPSQTIQAPGPMARTGLARSKTIPAKPFEVAIPPASRVDNGDDAESFMEILIWKKSSTAEGGNL